jgi:hypothetical protein
MKLISKLLTYSSVIASVAALSHVSAQVFVTSSDSSANSFVINEADQVAILFGGGSFGGGSSSITVTELGAFSPGTDGTSVDFGGNLTVTLWQSGVSSPLASVSIGGGTIDGNFVYKSVTPVTIDTLHNNYALTVVGWNGVDIDYGKVPNESAPTYDSAYAYYQDYHYTGTTATNPWASLDTGYGTAGTGVFTLGSINTTAVPEPEVYAALTGLALVGFGLYRRQVAK